jgi:hypothetical protein
VRPAGAKGYWKQKLDGDAKTRRNARRNAWKAQQWEAMGADPVKPQLPMDERAARAKKPLRPLYYGRVLLWYDVTGKQCYSLIPQVDCIASDWVVEYRETRALGMPPAKGVPFCHSYWMRQ